MDNYGGYHNRSTYDRHTTPLGQIETTLGGFPVTITKDGYEIVDLYDFARLYPRSTGSFYETIRRLASDVNTPESAPDDEKQKIVIRGTRRDK